MPYVNKKDREHIEGLNKERLSGNQILDLVTALRSVPSGKTKGAVNYTVSRLVAAAMRPEEGWSYTSLSEAIGVLRDAAGEMQRRLMNPYESAAIRKYGDIPEYRNTNGETPGYKECCNEQGQS